MLKFKKQKNCTLVTNTAKKRVGDTGEKEEKQKPNWLLEITGRRDSPGHCETMYTYSDFSQTYLNIATIKKFFFFLI